MAELDGPPPGTSTPGGKPKGLLNTAQKKVALPLVFGMVVLMGILVWFFFGRGKSGSTSTSSQRAVAQQGYANPTGTADVAANEISGLQMQMSNLESMLNNQYQALANQNQPASTVAQPAQSAPPANQPAWVNRGNIVSAPRFGMTGAETGAQYYSSTGQPLGLLGFGSEVTFTGGPQELSIPWAPGPGGRTETPVYPFQAPGGSTGYVQTVDVGRFGGMGGGTVPARSYGRPFPAMGGAVRGDTTATNMGGAINSPSALFGYNSVTPDTLAGPNFSSN
jgi:hypothetical protein